MFLIWVKAALDVLTDKKVFNPAHAADKAGESANAVATLLLC